MELLNPNEQCQTCIHYDVCKGQNLEYQMIDESKYATTCPKYSNERDWLHSNIPIGTEIYILNTCNDPPMIFKTTYTWQTLLDDYANYNNDYYNSVIKKYTTYEDAVKEMKKYVECQKAAKEKLNEGKIKDEKLQ